MAFRLAVASAYPPNRRPLSEYVWHVVESLRKSARVEHIHVLADRGPEGAPLPDERVSVHQCWSFGGVDQPLSVVQWARRCHADAVWFHMHMTSGGNTRSSQFAGVAAPAVCRIAGIPTVVTLHNMLGLTDLKWARPKSTWFDVCGGHLATALLRVPHSVCVLLPEYATLLRSHYGIDARLMPMGTLGTPRWTVHEPAASSRSLLVFGRFGSYKRLEVVLEAVSELAAEGEQVRLVVAGTDSRQATGYLEAMRQQYRHRGFIEFFGYVPEDAVPSLFEQSATCILPYATVTGMSSVATQAAMYGVPIIASDIPGVQSFEQRGLRINFFDWPDVASLKRTIRHVLASPLQCRQDVAHNLRYSQSQLMDNVVEDYLDIIEAVVSARRKTSAGLVRAAR